MTEQRLQIQLAFEQLMGQVEPFLGCVWGGVFIQNYLFEFNDALKMSKSLGVKIWIKAFTKVMNIIFGCLV